MSEKIFKEWCKYCLKYYKDNKRIHYKNVDGPEIWYGYDENNNEIDITEEILKEIEFRKQEKECLNRTKVSRFELMEI